MSDQPHIAFLGLGVMERPIGGYLARADRRLAAFNRTLEGGLRRVEAWSSKGLTAAFAANRTDAARGAEIGFTCVGKDEDLAKVTLGDHGVPSALITPLPRRSLDQG